MGEQPQEEPEPKEESGEKAPQFVTDQATSADSEDKLSVAPDRPEEDESSAEHKGRPSEEWGS